MTTNTRLLCGPERCSGLVSRPAWMMSWRFRPDFLVLACGACMIPPDWLPKGIRESGMVPDLRTGIAQVVGLKARQPGTAVIFNMDHTEATYAAAEFLAGIFDEVVILTPRDTIGTYLHLMARQGLLRRMAQQHVRIVGLSVPVWSEAFGDGTLEYENVYTNERGGILNVAFLAYSTPRAPKDGLSAGLRAAGVVVRAIGDCLTPGELLAATASGHDAGNSI